MHTPSIIEAEEAEEIGVEHLLRDIRDVAVGTLATRVTNQLQSLRGLHTRLEGIGGYLEKVMARKLPVNHAILGNLQDVFNLLPNLSTPTPPGAGGNVAPGGASTTATGTGSGSSELAYAMSIKTNDQLMAIYLSSLIRAITAFHDLIENKVQNRQQQEEKEAAKKDEAAGAAANGGAGGAAKDGDAEKKEDGGNAKDKKDKEINGVNGEAKEADGADKDAEGKGRKK